MAPRELPLEGRSGLPEAAGIFTLALIPRIAHILEIRAAGLGDFLRLDPLYYQAWARRIAAGDWLGSEAFEMSPLYSYALGILYALAGEGLTLPRVLQALLGSATCVLAFLLGRRLFGKPAGLAAGVALAVYGPAIFYDAQINKTSLALALTLGFAATLVRSEARERGWIAAGGALLGLTALVHENVNLAAPWILLWIGWPRSGERWSARAGLAGIFVAAYAAVVLPVTIRNVAVSGELVLITAAGGENFYTGNNPEASGRYSPPPFVRPDPFFEHEDFRVEAARRLGHPVTRKEASRFWWGEGLRFIAGDPGRFAWLIWDKVSVFLNAFERPDNYSYDNFRRFSPTLALPWPGFALVAPLALLGIVVSAPRWRELFPLYAAAGAYAISAIIFFTQSRYRMPAVPILCIFAGAALPALWKFTSGRRWRDLALSAALVACAFLFVTRDPGNGPGFHAQNDAILGELYLRAGRPSDAAVSLRRALAVLEPAAQAGDATFGRIAGAAGLALGIAERERGDAAAAEEAFRRAAECPDGDVRRDALGELAGLLESRGDRAAAAAAMGSALELSPSDHALRLRRARLLYVLGRHGEMIDELQRMLTMVPPPGDAHRADAWQGLALARFARGETALAREALDRVDAIDPGRGDSAELRRRLTSLGEAP